VGDVPHGAGLASGTPRELLADAVDQFADLSMAVVSKAMDSVVDAVPEATRLKPIAEEGARIAGEGMKWAEGRLKKALRPKKKGDREKG
jgi:hypothetical protein